ncbi:actin-related protein 10 [Lycorma delicatula]|uniref:actin-related protein 10 n=1 Tax=Lycorma delicatula TaxID=130591 RepID=UPI003F512150
MPLFDCISLSEKHAVVFDIGTRFTKFGFAGEPSPRCIIPSEVKCAESGKIRPIHSYKNESDLYALLVDFIHLLYFKHALVSPKDRRVVIVESLLCPTIFRDTLAKVLFRHFEVSSILYVPSHLVSLSTLGISTGLIIDIGYQEAILIPVYEGVPVLSSWQAQPLAALAVHRRLKDDLVEYYKNIEKESGEKHEGNKISDNIVDLPDSVIEDIRVRGCFVTNRERAQRFALADKTDLSDKTDSSDKIKDVPDLVYRIGGKRIITIPGKIRESCHEVFFEYDNDYLSLPNMILDAIISCSVDMRKPLAANIVLTGGTSMTHGLKYRLLQELKHLINTERYKEKFKFDTFKFHKMITKENYGSWLGGAIFGATDVMMVRSLTKEAYLGFKCVPDWSSLIHNRSNKEKSQQQHTL